jgi:hypothetical protein
MSGASSPISSAMAATPIRILAVPENSMQMEKAR